MESASQRSRMTGKYSNTSSFQRRYISSLKNKDHNIIDDIDEAAELERLQKQQFVDQFGNRIELSDEQMEIIDKLVQQSKDGQYTEKQLAMLQSIDYENLKEMTPDEIDKLLQSNGLQIPYQSKPHDRTNKRLYSFNYHENSDEYKQLGTLHKEKRTVEYFPQDEQLMFSTKPKIFGKTK